MVMGPTNNALLPTGTLCLPIEGPGDIMEEEEFLTDSFGLFLTDSFGLFLLTDSLACSFSTA
jgi:hypothetical protein